MHTILITDTHFGVKQNSMTWLKSQCVFIEDQLIPYIKSLKGPIKLIHLGDVFDSRSTISTYVASKVVELFKKLKDLVDEFIIIGGNHDYYSPNSDKVDTLNLLLSNLNINLVTTDIKIDKDCLYVPWYSWETDIQPIIDKYKIKNVFTHADIVTEKVNVKNCNIYSGHIHIPYIKGNLRNLGSCYALDFSDSNAPRGFYHLFDDNLKFIENEQSIRFWRLYNEDVFDLPNININDYIEIYVTQANLSTSLFNEKISELTKKYKNIWIIPQMSILESSGDIKFEGYDVAAITNELIPTELKDKFNIILETIKNT